MLSLSILLEQQQTDDILFLIQLFFLFKISEWLELKHIFFTSSFLAQFFPFHRTVTEDYANTVG